ncbi:MAG: NUDIX domain-containing protein [Candidatus Colwellbacteria bacterium]|nr:NUDIX domain-containing protein [Candidatus Colwellbacteria bacterium]
MKQKEVAAGFVIYRQTKEGPKFLLLYDRGRAWNLPRGKLGEEEKSFYGALRETQEETGLGRRDLRIKRGFRAYERFSFLRNGKRVSKTVIFYLAETHQKQIHLTKEHEGFGWFPFREARKLLKVYKGREAVLIKANDFIGRLPEPARPSGGPASRQGGPQSA